eukprot:8325526-Ditylum_brightwellii.AAC.1
MVSGVRETGYCSCSVVVEQIFCNAQDWTLEIGKENCWIFKEVSQERICNHPKPIAIGLGLSEGRFEIRLWNTVQLLQRRAGSQVSRAAFGGLRPVNLLQCRPYAQQGNREVNYWDNVCSKINLSNLELKVAGNCTDINIWSRVYCLE